MKDSYDCRGHLVVDPPLPVENATMLKLIHLYYCFEYAIEKSEEESVERFLKAVPLEIKLPRANAFPSIWFNKSNTIITLEYRTDDIVHYDRWLDLILFICKNHTIDGVITMTAVDDNDDKSRLVIKNKQITRERAYIVYVNNYKQLEENIARLLGISKEDQEELTQGALLQQYINKLQQKEESTNVP